MLRFSDLVVTSCTVLVLLTGPATSAADPIAVQVTAGSLNMSGIGGALSLVGDHDFTFLGGVSVIGGVFGPSITCLPCLPGDVISLQAHWDGNDSAARRRSKALHTRRWAALLLDMRSAA